MNPPSLDLTPLRNAVKALEGAIATIEDDAWLQSQTEALRNTVIAGVIQHFEFTYELATRTLRRHLSQTALNPDEAHAATFRDLLRIGGETGLIEDVEAWFEYRRLRNLTSHAYDKSKAEEVLAGAPPFLADAKSLLTRLEARGA